jgi:SNF2 family DNA or RNA helicase
MIEIPTTIPPLYLHQEETRQFMKPRPRIFDMSDPGTGKTRGHLQAFVDRLNHKQGRRALVLAPKSILQLAWGNDIDKFFPGLRYSVAYATNREAAFRSEADIYITNHDAIKWLNSKDCPLGEKYLDTFDTFLVDESTCYKHYNSQRSKAARAVAKRFEFRELLTGTPNPNSVTELWHQAYLLDEGERLGTSFWKFRNVVQESEQIGPAANHIKWVDKDGAEEAVFDMLRDITIRHELKDVPGNHTYSIEFDLKPKVRKAYQEMLDNAITITEKGEMLTAVHASSLNTKLLQIASGAVYTGIDGEYATLTDQRTDLVMDLLEARSASVVVFQWRHQREALVKAAEKRGFKYAFIDGSVTSPQARIDAVNSFQAGDLKAIFVHPQSAGYGLTLTRGKATIFVSPTYNAEHYKQVFHRIVRATQTDETETIHIVAKNTIDEYVYEKLGGKLDSMSLLLALVSNNKEF